MTKDSSMATSFVAINKNKTKVAMALAVVALLAVTAFCVVFTENSNAVDEKEFTDKYGIKYQVTKDGTPGEVKVIGAVESVGDEINIKNQAVDEKEGAKYIVTAIDKNADWPANRITSVTIEKIALVDESAFSGLESLKKVTIMGEDNERTRVEDQAFSNCKSLKTLKLSNVSFIGDMAFANTSLDKVDIPDCVTNIGKSAFSGCKKLSELTIGSKEKSASTTEIVINEGAFEDSPIEKLTIKVCKINQCEYAFDKKDLTYVKIDQGASGWLSTLLKNYEFYDKDGKILTDEKIIAEHEYKGSGDGKLYESYNPPTPPTPSDDDGKGLDIGLIIGIIVAILAVAAVAFYFLYYKKKQQQ